MANNTDYKRCCHCKELKPKTLFHRNAKRKDGLQSWCYPCRAHYNYSDPRGQETRKRYIESGKYQAWFNAHPHYWTEWYHRIQDEAGCHWDIRSFYPGYRFLKALMESNYTVVEDKEN